MNMSIPPAPFHLPLLPAPSPVAGEISDKSDGQKPILPWNYLCGHVNTLVSRTRIAKETCGRLVCITVKEAREDDPNPFYRRLWKRSLSGQQQRTKKRRSSREISINNSCSRGCNAFFNLWEKREGRILSGYRRHSRCVTSNVPTGGVQHPDVIVILRRYDLPKNYADIFTIV